MEARKFRSGMDQRRVTVPLNVVCGSNKTTTTERWFRTAVQTRTGYGVSPSVSSIRVPHGSVKKATCTFLELWLV
jgi:hypothetical protein